tara:strand:- start:183 stop:830 length:648 start_codon:yes stop_codon:yes gene_type:complete
MSDMKLIMENWRKFTTSQEEEINEAIEPVTQSIIALGFLALALRKAPVNISASDQAIVGTYDKTSLLGTSLAELLGMAGLGALASGGVSQKIKGLWNKLRGHEPEAAKEIAADTAAGAPKTGPEKEAWQAFINKAAEDPRIERVINTILRLVEDGAPEEDIVNAVDAANKVIADIGEETAEETGCPPCPPCDGEEEAAEEVDVYVPARDRERGVT